MVSAEVDKRSEAIYQFGFVLSKFDDHGIRGITRDAVDRDFAIVTYYDEVIGREYNRKVNIAGDSVLQAIKDIIKSIEERSYICLE